MMRTLYFLLAILGVISAPVDDPVRIDLPVYEPLTSSTTSLTETREPGTSATEIYPAVEYNYKQDNKKTDTIVLSSKVNSNPLIGAVNYGGGLFSPAVTKLEGALLETEGLDSKVLSVKENVQSVVAGVFQPQPIVDTIKEEEKYGNTGDKFESTGRAIVNGAEGLSNFINSILEVPSKIFRSITRAASEKLNNFGGKLVGL